MLIVYKTFYLDIRVAYIICFRESFWELLGNDAYFDENMCSHTVT